MYSTFTLKTMKPKCIGLKCLGYSPEGKGTISPPTFDVSNVLALSKKLMVCYRQDCKAGRQGYFELAMASKPYH